MSDLIQLEQVGFKIPHEDAEYQRERVSDLLGTHNKSFPGAQPVSFASQHLRALQEADYFLCEKTDGIRCLLFLTFTISGQDGAGRDIREETAFLIDRKNDYYYINNPHLHFPLPNRPDESFHTQTLIDGELVLDTEKDGRRVRRYMVFDCMALDNESQMNRVLPVRLQKFKNNVFTPYEDLLKKFPEEREQQPFEVVMKQMQKSYGIKMLLVDVLPNLPHGNDGLVFTACDTPYVTGTDQHIIKWKPPHENTIDFRLQIGLFPPLHDSTEQNGVPPEGIDGHDYQPDYDACPTISLLVFHGNNKNEFFADLHVTDDEWNSMKSMNQILDGRIIECYKDSKGRWRYKREKDGTPRFRDDKTQANHISTVRSVLESIEDAVSEADLLKHDGQIKNKWKAREMKLVEMKQKQEEMRKAEMLRRQEEMKKRAE